LPAKAGIQGLSFGERSAWFWFPAFAGKAGWIGASPLAQALLRADARGEVRMPQLRSFGWLGAGLLLALVLRALPAEAQFYSLDGRFQCLDNPRAVCFDATSDVPRPAPAAPRAAELAPRRAAPAKQVAAIAKAPSAPVDPLPAMILRLEARKPGPGDIALLRRRAHAGDKRAVELLAWANLKGIGVAPDPMEAYLLYGFGASLGVPHAKRNQAVVYETMMTPEQRQEVLTIEDETLTPPPR
jgi:hypothetical protein